MELSEYDKKRLIKIKDVIGEDDWEWLCEFIDRSENTAWLQGRDAQYRHSLGQSRTVTHVHRRRRDDRGILEKATDFIFGE